MKIIRGYWRFSEYRKYWIDQKNGMQEILHFLDENIIRYLSNNI